MKISKIKLEKLHRAEYNPRVDLKPGDAEFENIRRSIEEFGFVQPLVVNERTMTIIGGDQRYKVLLDMGEESAECVRVDLDPEAERALNVALNKISGNWDAEKLETLLRELDASELDATVTGFAPGELAELFRDADAELAHDDGFDSPLPEVPFTKPGDLWLLGAHRLYCGSCTSEADVKAALGDSTADMILTDPPYNVAYESKAGKIMNDAMTPEQFREFLGTAFRSMRTAVLPGAPVYVFHSERETISFRQALQEAGFFIHQTCIWAKNSAVIGRCDYQWDYEPVLAGEATEPDGKPVIYGWAEGAGHPWYGGRRQRTVWCFDRPTKSKYHPTMKPIDLMAYPIGNSSVPGAVVFDPFCGSASTLIACQQLRRCGVGIELDPKYVDLSIERFIKFMDSTDDIILVRDGKTTPFWDLNLS